MSFLSGLIGLMNKNNKNTLSSTKRGIAAVAQQTQSGTATNIFDDGSGTKVVSNSYTKPYTTPIQQASREAIPMYQILDVPNWGYKDYINERIEWQKGLNSAFNEPAFFYFKIFFKFDTSYGLLGGILGGKDGVGCDYKAENTAHQYLIDCSKSKDGKLYTSDKLDDRKEALVRFVKTLSYISSKAPWLFEKIKDVNLGLTLNFENLAQEKSVEITCKEETIDLKLTTLFDLYKVACFDDINQKEIIPENLRKFDMDVVVFQAPLRYYQTSTRSLKNQTSYYKNLYDNDNGDLDNRMSFKLFSFLNCEFDYKNLATGLPAEFSTDSPFQSKPTIKIKYERVYQHNQNEYAGLLFGSNGILWTALEDNYKAISEKENSRKDPHIDIHKYANSHSNYHNSSSQVYKAMVDATESTVSAAMLMLDGKSTLGNLYGESKFGESLLNSLKSVGNQYKNSVNNLGRTLGIDRIF